MTLCALSVSRARSCRARWSSSIDSPNGLCYGLDDVTNTFLIKRCYQPCRVTRIVQLAGGGGELRRVSDVMAAVVRLAALRAPLIQCSSVHSSVENVSLIWRHCVRFRWIASLQTDILDMRDSSISASCV